MFIGLAPRETPSPGHDGLGDMYMTCARCDRRLSDTNAYRRTSNLCHVCSVHFIGLRSHGSVTYLHGANHAKRQTGLRKITTILKGLP
jgi:hypothetical protein